MRLVITFLLIVTAFATFAQDVYRVNSIEIEGNKLTKRTTILRELSFEIGDSLTKLEFNEKLNQSKLNISSQWLFNFIEIKPSFTKNEIDVNIKVVERWYVWPYPILEISERNFNVFWDSLQNSNFNDFSRLNYGVFLNWYNFRGRNEILKVKFRKGYKEHYLFEYDIPYINKTKTLGTIIILEMFRMKQFHYKTIDNTLIYKEFEDERFRNWNGSFSLQYKKDLNLTHRLSLKHSIFETPQEIQTLNPNFLGVESNRFEFSSMEYHYENEKRNSISYPTEGSFNEVLVSGFIGRKNDFKNLQIIAKTENHFNLRPRWHLGNSIKVKAQTNTSLPYILNESLGFEDYLRGYEYYVFDGEHYVMSKTALKYELVPKQKLDIPYLKMEQFKKTHYSIYFSIFADMGTVVDNQYPDENQLNNIFLMSQGVSLDFVTYYDKLIRLEYSRNHLNQWGLFIHFSNPF
jgi:outer membrane protein assembly factor BamA